MTFTLGKKHLKLPPQPTQADHAVEDAGKRRQEAVETSARIRRYVRTLLDESASHDRLPWTA